MGVGAFDGEFCADHEDVFLFKINPNFQVKNDENLVFNMDFYMDVVTTSKSSFFKNFF